MTTTPHQDAAPDNLSHCPELEQLFGRIQRLIDLVTHQTGKLHDLQNELEILKEEHHVLLAERECLNQKINLAQSRLRTMLAQLPENEGKCAYEKQEG